jgi:CubicO group peptidase (beta-lactamase class C family)
VKGYGGVSGERRGLIASLSKAITGACTATLIQQGNLRFDTTLGELLPARYGEPRDPRLQAMTIAQLLTHRSGFGRGESRDPATGTTLSEALGRRAVTQITMRDLVPGVLRHKLKHEPGATYAYTNASHLLLGIVIEELAGQRYDDYCGAAVLKPHRIKDPQLHSTWHVLGSFGGWSRSGPEYLAFLHDFAVCERERPPWRASFPVRTHGDALAQRLDSGRGRDRVTTGGRDERSRRTGENHQRAGEQSGARNLQRRPVAASHASPT